VKPGHCHGLPYKITQRYLPGDVELDEFRRLHNIPIDCEPDSEAGTETFYESDDGYTV